MQVKDEINMRISPQQQLEIKKIKDVAGDIDASVVLFGSRIDDNKRGGDVDLLIDVPREIERPARLAAEISAQVSRMMAGRSIDVIILAPNLEVLPIHRHAKSTGIQL